MTLPLLLLSFTAHAAAPPDLSTFWAPWFASPYEHMMTSDPGWPDAPPAAKTSGAIFGAGTDGFYRYGGMWDCLRVYHDGTREEKAYAWLEGMAGTPLQIGHIGEGYQRGFSAYSPALIDWAANNLIPDPKLPYRGGTFQDAYDQTFFRAVRLFALAYRTLTTTYNLDAEAAAYKQAMATEPEFDGIDWLEARYGGDLRGAYPLSGDGTMMTAPMAMGFWLRRHLDGSAETLSKHLDGLLQTYDPAFCAQIKKGRRGCLL